MKALLQQQWQTTLNQLSRRLAPINRPRVRMNHHPIRGAVATIDVEAPAAVGGVRIEAEAEAEEVEAHSATRIKVGGTRNGGTWAERSGSTLNVLGHYILLD